MNGWIKLHRSLLEWEWYNDKNTLKLFIHLLLKANIRDNEWQGIIIKRGSFITSRKNLSTETGLTEREVRTALSRLEKTGEITRKTTNKYTLITLVKYDNYQDKEEEATSKRPANDQQTTTTKEYKKEKNNSVSVKELKEFFKRFQVKDENQKQIEKYLQDGMKLEVIENGLLIPYNRNVMNFDFEIEEAPIQNPDAYGYTILREWHEFGVKTMEEVKKYNRLLKSKKGRKNNE